MHLLRSFSRCLRYPLLYRAPVADLSVSVMFPFNGSVTRPLPSLLPGTDGSPSPAFFQYYEAATTAVVFRLSPPLLSALVQTALWLTSLWFARSGQEVCGLHARWVFSRCHPFPVFGPQGTYGSHKFPVNPFVPLPCSLTPVEPGRLTLAALRFRPPSQKRGGPRTTLNLSELYHTASALAVYASCRHYWRRRKTRFRGMAALSRVGFQFTH